jgi:hypothetical protein
MSRWLKGLYRWQFRIMRWVLNRDNCEVCDGSRGVRGNENRIGTVRDYVVMCDYCSVEKHEDESYELPG